MAQITFETVVSPLTNDIPAKQVQPDMVALMRARFRYYRAAKWAQGIFVLSTIAVPVASVLATPGYPVLKPYLVLTALILLLLDVAFFDPFQKDRMKRGAKLQEEFDTKVLGMTWNRFVAGKPVDHEDVRTGSVKPLSRKREEKLMPWYEPYVGEVSLPFGRLLCQRTNIVYDTRLRKRYANALLGTTVALFVVLLIAGLALDLNLSDLLLTVFVPSTPVFSWALRECRKQRDTTTALETLKSEFEKLWEKALTGATATELERGARELQDAIYQHRAKSPLVFDWAYDFLRTTNENEAHHAVQQLVMQAKAAMSEEPQA